MPLLPELADLRIKIFRDFPYLYEGDAASELTYLRTYVAAPGAAVIVAQDGDSIVGASTCLPLREETPNVQKPFIDAGWDTGALFYFGESVLRHEYRGQGIGVKFFEYREAQAAGFTTTAFCAVQRPAARAPAGYKPLDDFWHKRGYTKQPNLTCQMSWRDVGDTGESEKTLTFWTKVLTP